MHADPHRIVEYSSRTSLSLASSNAASVSSGACRADACRSHTTSPPLLRMMVAVMMAVMALSGRSAAVVASECVAMHVGSALLLGSQH